MHSLVLKFLNSGLLFILFLLLCKAPLDSNGNGTVKVNVIIIIIIIKNTTVTTNRDMASSLICETTDYENSD